MWKDCHKYDSIPFKENSRAEFLLFPIHIQCYIYICSKNKKLLRKVPQLEGIKTLATKIVAGSVENKMETLSVLQELWPVCFSGPEYAISVLKYMLNNVNTFLFNGFKHFCGLDSTSSEADVA